MKKTKKLLIALLLAIVTAFGVAGCNVDTQNDLQGKIDYLQSQIEELEERLAEMNDQIVERDATIEDLNNQITNLKEQIEQLEKELADKLPEEEELMGTFYTLQEAYNNGWLTQADLMSIAYYHNGGRRYNEEIMSEDYEPLPKTPEVLSEERQLKIKSTAANDYRENYNIMDAEADGFTITEYCGTYGDCVAVMMRDEYSGEAGIVWTDSIAGVNINYGGGKTIQIWRDTK